MAGNSNSFGIPKPAPPIKLSMPKGDELYLHPGENATGYNWLMEKVQFLSAMSKFFPDFENEMLYEGVPTEASLYQFGDAKEPFTFEGQTNPPNGLDADECFNPEGFGAYHRSLMGADFWGAGLGKQAQKTINYNPSAADFYGNGTVDADSYGKTLGDPDTEYSNYSNIWADVVDYMKDFGNKSYYEIFLSGLKDENLIEYIKDEGTGKDVQGGPQVPQHSIKWDKLADGNDLNWELFDFDYEDKTGENGKGAFYFMVSMLEDRRRINQSMSELFAPPSLLHSGKDNTPDDKAIINNIEGWLNDPNKGKGVFSSNLGILSLYLATQHSYHSISTAFTGGYDYKFKAKKIDEGENGYAYAIKDLIASKYFRRWVRTNAQDYVDSLSGDEADWAQNLYDEFSYEIGNQPYGAKMTDLEQDGQWFIGWDMYCDKKVWEDSANKNTLVEKDTTHRAYLISQITDLSKGQLTGMGDVNGKNYFADNWGVHAVGRFDGYQWKFKSMISSRFLRMQLDRIRYSREMGMYRQKIENAKDQKAYEQKLEAKTEAKHMAEKKKVNSKHKAHNNTKKQSQSVKERMKEMGITSDDVRKQIVKGMQSKYFARLLEQRKAAMSNKGKG